MVDQWDHRQKEIWDRDQMDQWDLHRKVIWVKCTHIWMMQVHTMDQALKDQMDLLQEQIWMVMEWLHHRRLMILLTM